MYMERLFMIFLLSWNDIAELFGRTHPFLVHLPIGILLLAVLMEFTGIVFKKQELSSAVLFALAAGLISSLIAGLSGYFLSWQGGYSEDLLNTHRWVGVGLTVVNAVALVIKAVYKDKEWCNRIYIPVLTLLFFLVLYAGHLGGSLTHGSDFLSFNVDKKQMNEPITPAYPLDKISNPGEAILFKDIVHPILQAYCQNCHNPDKKKALFDVSSYTSIIKGGESGPFVIGDSDGNEILRRLKMATHNKERMPPKGKMQLSEVQKSLIEFWIISGMKEYDELKSDRMPAGLAQKIDEVTKPLHPVYDTHSVRRVDDATVNELREKGFGISFISEEHSLLDVRFKFKRNRIFSDLADDLQPISNHIVWLDLGGTHFSDVENIDLSQFEKLIRLKLNQTNIDDNVLKTITELRYLEYLNLHSTSITDSGLENLLQLPGLNKVILWNTDAGQDAVKKFNLNIQSINLVEEVQDDN